MPPRDVLRLGDPRLRARSDEVGDPSLPEARQAIVDLCDTLEDFRATRGFGRAISAVQIGVPLRIVCLNLDRPIALIDPVLLSASDEKVELWDDCFCFPDLMVKVERARRVVVRHRAPDGTDHAIAADGALSELLQHELDHLDGILAVDRALDRDSLCLRSEWERRYAKQ